MCTTFISSQNQSSLFCARLAKTSSVFSYDVADLHVWMLLSQAACSLLLHAFPIIASVMAVRYQELSNVHSICTLFPTVIALTLYCVMLVQRLSSAHIQ